ncbi:MAG: ArsA family ATPase [Nanoarchaeota archaeon]
MNKKCFHLFTGKGGTGKTTLSVATAVYYAKIGKNTLIASIDPAHSLSDCLGIHLDSKPIEITKNLFGIEIDSKEALKRDRFLIKHTHNILKSLGIHDTDILETFPGIDEVMAYDMLVEFIENKDYDQVVFDTAPSGHALRFLSIPGHIDDWLKKSFRAGRQISSLLSIAKKMKIEGPSYRQEHEERDRMSKIYKMLTNPEYSSISIVTLPEKMSIAETERDVITLISYGLPVKEIIINQIFPESNDDFLKNKYYVQKKNIISIRKKFNNLRIKEVPYFTSEIIGLEELEKISNILFQ